MATYRVQLRPEFGFSDAAALVDYLADLGISHMYCSPYLQAAPGSVHGYDVADPERVNAELGGSTGRDELCAALAGRGLGQMLDIVPNHMAISGAGEPLVVGCAGQRTGQPVRRSFRCRLGSAGWRTADAHLLPVLGDDLDRVLAAGELALESSKGGFVVRYHEHTFPVAAESLDGLADDGTTDTLRQVLDRQHYRLVHLAHGLARAELPPVLRCHDAHRRAGGGPNGLRRHPPPHPRLVG